MNKKGFTLVELLVVIAIIIVLAAILVLLLNPSELLAQAQDTTRVNDINNLDKAVAIVKTYSGSLDNTQPDIVYVSLPDTVGNHLCSEYSLPVLANGWSYRCMASSTNLTNNNGTGWLPIDFAAVASDQVAKLPVDPVNSAASGNYYAYGEVTTAPSGYFLASKMSSSKFSSTLAANDGGNISNAYETGPVPWELALSTPYVWVSDYNTGSVAKVNESTGAIIGSYSGGDYIVGVAVDGSGNVWAAHDFSTFTVTEINGSTGAVIGSYSAGSNPFDVAIDPSGNVWVTDNGGSSVTKLNGSTGATIGTYSTGSTPAGVAVDQSGNVWVANSGTTTVTKLNGSTGATIGTYTVSTLSNFPDGVAVNASGNIWVTIPGANSVVELNGSTGAVMATYSAGGYPQGIAIDSSGDVWVTNFGSATVTELNGSTGSIIRSPSAGTNPIGIAIDASGNVWVTHNGGTVNEINGSTGAAIGTYVSSSSSGDVGDFTGFAYQYFLLGRR